MENSNPAPEFRFSPLSFSWVALHPQPKGVVQFIGGIFFGSFPNIFYRYLLEQLYLNGYTIVALPFRFTFRHWSVAISLLQEQQALIPLLQQKAQELNYDFDVYQKADCYRWLGHSLGCKYIALLELLANWSLDAQSVRDHIRKNVKRPEVQIRQIEECLLDLSTSVRNQKSLLIAPEISNTQDAIKVPFLPQLLDAIDLGVLPTKQETLDLIQQSNLFNLTKMVSFDRDQIAGSKNDSSIPDKTVKNLIKILEPKLISAELTGKHLRPLGLKINNYLIGPIATPPPELITILLNFLE